MVESDKLIFCLFMVYMYAQRRTAFHFAGSAAISLQRAARKNSLESRYRRAFKNSCGTRYTDKKNRANKPCFSYPRFRESVRFSFDKRGIIWYNLS